VILPTVWSVITTSNRTDQLSVADQIFECIPEEKDEYV